MQLAKVKRSGWLRWEAQATATRVTAAAPSSALWNVYILSASCEPDVHSSSLGFTKALPGRHSCAHHTDENTEEMEAARIGFLKMDTGWPGQG